MPLIIDIAGTEASLASSPIPHSDYDELLGCSNDARHSTCNWTCRLSPEVVGIPVQCGIWDLLRLLHGCNAR